VTTYIFASLVLVTGGDPLVVAGAEGDLNVLPSHVGGGPTRQMLSHHLERQAQRAFDRREAEYEKLKTERPCHTRDGNKGYST